MTNSLVLTERSTLEDALRTMDRNGNGTLPVVDEYNKLIGLITDGDIRRGLLNKKTKLIDFVNKNPITLKDDISYQQAVQYLKNHHLRQILIVDDNNTLVKVVVLDDLELVSRPNSVVIMAGGLGTRLGELTNEVPKPMLKVGGRPILHNIVDSFKDFGFHNFIFCVNYKSHIIEDYFEDGDRYGVNINYCHEEKRMGTAGALSLIEQRFDEPIFVVNGDVLTTVNYHNFLRFHSNANAVASMCVKKINFQMPYAQVQIDSNLGITELREKPVHNYHINTGIYLLNQTALDLIPKGQFFDMTTLFDELIQNGHTVKGFQMDEYWVDIGKKEDYFKALQDYAN